MKGVADFGYTCRQGRIEYLAVSWSRTDEFGRPLLERLGWGASASLLPFAMAQAIATVPADISEVRPGDILALQPVDFRSHRLQPCAGAIRPAPLSCTDRGIGAPIKKATLWDGLREFQRRLDACPIASRRIGTCQYHRLFRGCSEVRQSESYEPAYGNHSTSDHLLSLVKDNPVCIGI